MKVGDSQALHTLQMCAYYCSNIEVSLVSSIQKRMLEDMAQSKKSYIILSNLSAVVGASDHSSEVALAQIQRHMHNYGA
ncbi:MAG: hypothetical protein P0S95_06310 [Rhabdochlamydiaceae bacterium]|nr:hypothetical protein [Candidatus Amphrikana amoebophyrae]